MFKHYIILKSNMYLAAHYFKEWWALLFFLEGDITNVI